METAVLPARDHLAEHQYRHHTRAVSGLVSPAGANPRSRRKSGKATPPAVIASMVSDAARIYLTGSFAAPSSAADLPSGVYRGVSAPASPRGRFPGSSALSSGGSFSHRAGASFSSAVKSSSHGVHHGPTSSSVPLAGHYYGAGQGRANGLPRPSSEISSSNERSHSRRACEKKGIESVLERPIERVSERKNFDKRAPENGRTSPDRRFAKVSGEVSALDKRSAKPFEASEKRELGERKFGGGRKISDREKASPHSENRRLSGVKPSKQKNLGALTGAVTILKRPQTEEAAAENLAIITGVPLAEICMKNGLVTRQTSVHPEASTSSGVGTVPPAGVKLEMETCSTPLSAGNLGKVAEPQQTRNVLSPRKVSVVGGNHLCGGITEGPPNKVLSPVLDSEVEQVAGPVFEKAEVQQGPTNSHKQCLSRKGETLLRSSRAKHSESQSGAQVAVDNRGKGGESPKKECARMVPKFLERSGSLTLFSPGGVTSLATSSHKSGSGSFSFVDAFSDLTFFPRSPVNERWAGPAYSNSPPPSSLPFPTFSLQKLRETSSGELGAFTGEAMSLLDFPDTVSVAGSSLSSAPSSPSRGSVVLSSSDDLQQLHTDVTCVTRDLRRMLNLDLSGNVELSTSAALDDMKETLATQGLKRILQLG